MKYILSYIKNLYKGRISRLDYFTSPLILFLLVLVPMLLSFGTYGMIDTFSSSGFGDVSSLLLFLNDITLFFSILFLLPALIYFLVFICGVIVRRGHDIGWSAWFSLFMYAIGQIIIIPLFFLFFQKSDKGENQYGTLQEDKYFRKAFGINKIPRIVKYIYGFLVFAVLINFIILFSTLIPEEDAYVSDRKSSIDLTDFHREFSYLEPFSVTLIQSAYMRQEPSTSSGIIRGYSDTEIVKVIGEKGDWYKIQARDDWGNLLTGWMTKLAF